MSSMMPAKIPSFEKVSREQVEWGLDRLKGVVEPALRHGKGADYFAARDADEGLSGERSYSGVYNWFYNSDHAIKVTRATGGYVVTNGYHRLAVARETWHRHLAGDHSMTSIGGANADFARALADFDATLSSTQAWRDGQRTRLERAQLVPLRAEGNRYLAALRVLDASLEAAQRLLNE